MDLPQVRLDPLHRPTHPLASAPAPTWPAGHEALERVFEETMDAVDSLKDRLTARSCGHKAVAYAIRCTTRLHERLETLWVHLLTLDDVQEPRWRAELLVEVMSARRTVSLELADGLTLAVGWRGRVMDTGPIREHARRRWDQDRLQIAARLQADEHRLLHQAERTLTGPYRCVDLVLDLVGQVRATYPVWRRVLSSAAEDELPRPDVVRAEVLLERACRAQSAT